LLFVTPKAYLLHYFTIYSLKQTAMGLLDQTERGCWLLLDGKWNRSRV